MITANRVKSRAVLLTTLPFCMCLGPCRFPFPAPLWGKNYFFQSYCNKHTCSITGNFNRKTTFKHWKDITNIMSYVFLCNVISE